jgi:tRNA1Val (adenine37-N6)-methyltransferase
VLTYNKKHIHFLKRLKMKANGFTFKQFHVEQNGAAMKVTTDACVFGSWIDGPPTGRVLDAGTGTGLLALMLAQRFQQLEITGVELEEAAYRDAALNFSKSPFTSRLRAVYADVLTFQDGESFDAIVCNPPFFLNALPAESKPRNMARHASDTFSVDGFLDAVARLLRMNGELFLILPPAEASVWMEKAAVRNVFPISVCQLSHNQDRKPHRWMIAMRRQDTDTKPACAEGNLRLFENGTYSKEIQALLRPFYLYLD